MRSHFPLVSLVLCVSSFVTLVRGWVSQPDGYEVLPVPANISDAGAWRTKWNGWKALEHELIRYDPNDACNGYNQKQLQWTQKSFVQTQLMLHDRLIYDRESNKWTVNKYLDKMKQRYGGLDSVLIWASYPNSGIDNRNQWDWFRDLPGGLDKLKQVVDQFHKRGVKVFLPYNPWDTATRDEERYIDQPRMYEADRSMLYQLIDEIGADAINGDTMYGVPKEFYDCNKPVAVCPEGGVPSAYVGHNIMSWGYIYWGAYEAPPVSRTKFLETRHMVLMCSRWSLNRIRDIQWAFFNGVGYETWENVWGIFNGMTPRDDAAVKRVYTILREFDFAITTADWEPYATTLFPNTVFATYFPVQDRNLALWTLINDGDKAISKTTPSIVVYSGPRVHVDLQFRDLKHYDLYHGIEVSPDCSRDDQKGLTLCTIGIDIEAHGFGALLQIRRQDVGRKLKTFLQEMKELTKVPLAELSSKVEILPQQLVGWQESDSKKYSITNNDSTAGSGEPRAKMVRIKGTSSWEFEVNGVQVEPVPKWTPNMNDYGVGVQFPWEMRPKPNHRAKVRIPDFDIDAAPVTNSQFREFLRSGNYRPQDPSNFLQHWRHRPSNKYKEWDFGPDFENKPVVWVSIEDARAYAKFYGKRLPHDWEWQYAASGSQRKNKYPWGNRWEDATLPKVDHSKDPSSPADVGTHLTGCTDEGVCDLVGLVWQMTDEFCDIHTCGLTLRGGSYYQPSPSTLFDPNWYFPQAYQNTQHAKFLMLSESYDRNKMIGFRCVQDVGI